MSDIITETCNVLSEIKLGKISITAYDTAWIARLGEIDWELSSKALNWLSENQLPDGSWGADNVYYYHDRVISTLAAMISLTQRGRRKHDSKQVESGLLALERIIAGVTGGLTADPNGATVGFEMIVPTLVAEAEKMGLITQQKDRLLGRLSKMRAQKLSLMQGKLIDRNISMAYSAEMAGDDNISLFDVKNLQEVNGSVANSPSATAYFISHIDQNNQLALNYLKKSTNNGQGGASFAFPYDIYERAWILWNISIAPSLMDDPSIKEACKPHVEFLKSAWKPGKGVGFASTHSLCDGDDTSVTFEVLKKFGHELSSETILGFEADDHFRCYPLEVNPSIGANAHMLGAFKEAGFGKDHPAVQKILRYLKKSQLSNGYWIDKWHISPYYVTSHVIISCREYDRELCQSAIHWMLEGQNKDGGWGSIGFSTVEETAYCVQALKLWQLNGGHVPARKFNEAGTWLLQNYDKPHPMLWISKSLNSPELVVKMVILSAISLFKDHYK
ncbi:Type B diterpene cyclase [Anaerolineales bacterium]|nr:Type B diterpene cyclase [Anaerolineales bacterium]